jgi:hypothetical protein
MSEIDRMDWAFLCFANAMVWPPIKNRNDFRGKPLEFQNNIKKWTASTTVLQKGLLTWWDDMKARGRDLPAESNVSILNESLQVAIESSLQVVNTDVPDGVRVSLVETVAFIMTDVSGPGCIVRIGADAAIGLLSDIVETQRRHSLVVYKYPRTTTANSIPLTERRRMRPSVGFYYHKPTQSTREGNDVGMLFSIMLGLMTRHQYIARIIPTLKFPTPRVALDSKHFHHVYWKKLVTHEYNWLRMSIKAREELFFEFVFHLFTLDPLRKSMQPAFGCAPLERNNASWRGFFLSDEELLALVSESFTIYVDTKPEF